MLKHSKRFEIVIVNHILQRMYNLHIKDTLFEKILHYAVYFAITIILLHVLVIFYPIESIYTIVKILEPFVYAILALELIKEAATAQTYAKFFHKHWIDIMILVALSSSLLFVTYVGFMKIPHFESLKFMLEETKHFRAVAALFR